MEKFLDPIFCLSLLKLFCFQHQVLSDFSTSQMYNLFSIAFNFRHIYLVPLSILSDCISLLYIGTSMYINASKGHMNSICCKVVMFL